MPDNLTIADLKEGDTVFYTTGSLGGWRAATYRRSCDCQKSTNVDCGFHSIESVEGGIVNITVEDLRTPEQHAKICLTQ